MKLDTRQPLYARNLPVWRTEPARSCTVAMALAQAGHVAHAVTGRVAVEEHRLFDIGIGAAAGHEETDHVGLVETVVATLTDTLGFIAPGSAGDRADVGIAIEAWRSLKVLWLESDRCLVGILQPADKQACFVAFVRDTPGPGFGRWHHDLVRLSLAQQHERAAPAPRSTVGEADRMPAVEHVLQRLAVGLALVDSSMTVIYVNEAALAATRRDRDLTVVDGRLVVRCSRLRAALRAALEPDAATGRPRSSVVLTAGETDGSPSASITVLPVQGPRPHALLSFARRPDADRARDLVLDALGLTAAERRLARLLLSGHGLDEAAREANVTTSTARSYLKRIFAKTGTRRQSQLVAMVSALTPPVEAQLMEKAV